MKDYRYNSEIIRNPLLEDGPGQWTIYRDDTPIACFPCITGGDILDPTEYGGICPAVKLYMVTEIYPHIEPSREQMDFCQILPIDLKETQELFPKRTWQRPGDWFKIHAMGRSTGCIGPAHFYWDYAKSWLNQAYKHSQEYDYVFVIDLIDFTMA